MHQVMMLQFMMMLVWSRSIVETASVTTNSYVPTTLAINTQYWWAVSSNNMCGLVLLLLHGNLQQQIFLVTQSNVR